MEMTSRILNYTSVYASLKLFPECQSIYGILELFPECPTSSEKEFGKVFTVYERIYNEALTLLCVVLTTQAFV